MNLLILGCGGLGINCLEVARNMKVYESIAFLDDSCVGQTICDCSVIGKLNDSEQLINQYNSVVVAFGDNAMRSHWIEKMKSIGYSLPALISPLANISAYNQIEEGTIIFQFADVQAYATVKYGSIISTGSVIGHNATVEPCNLIFENAVIRPYSTVGKMSVLGAGCVISQKVTVPEKTIIAGCSSWSGSISKAKVDTMNLWTQKYKD